MTLGGAAAARVRLITWRKGCQHQVEPDPAKMAARTSPKFSVLDWRERLVCSKCGSGEIDIGHDPAISLRTYARRTKKADATAAAIKGALSNGVLGAT